VTCRAGDTAGPRDNM